MATAMYAYFVPPKELQVVPSVHSRRGDIYPLYDDNGEDLLYLFLVAHPHLLYSDVAPSIHSRGDLVPIYDEDGEFIRPWYLFLNHTLLFSNVGEVTGFFLKSKRLPLERSTKRSESKPQLLTNGKTLACCPLCSLIFFF